MLREEAPQDAAYCKRAVTSICFCLVTYLQLFRQSQSWFSLRKDYVNEKQKIKNCLFALTGHRENKRM